MDKKELDKIMQGRRTAVVTPVDLMANQQASIPASTQTSKPANVLTKYSTWLPGNLIKRVKLQAIEQGVNDYEILSRALEAYLDTKEKNG